MKQTEKNANVTHKELRVCDTDSVAKLWNELSLMVTGAFVQRWKMDSTRERKGEERERGQEGIAFIRCVVAWQMLAWASKALWQPPAESTVLLMCPGMPAP